MTVPVGAEFNEQLDNYKKTTRDVGVQTQGKEFQEELLRLLQGF